MGNLGHRFRSFSRSMSHLSMEIFGVMVGICILGFVSLFIWGFIVTGKRADRAFATDPLYTTSFATTRTHVSGEVIGLYTNDDHSSAALLLKFNDMSVLSRDAKSYQMLGMGSDEKQNYEELISSPIGSIYMYGRTGYMVATFENGTRFPKQIINVIFNNANVIDDVISSNSGSTDFASKYDIWQALINPGADGTGHTSAFDSGVFDPDTFFTETLLSDSEKSYRKGLGSDVMALGSLLAYIEEYEDRLSDAGVDVAATRPEWLVGDYVEKDADGAFYLRTTHVVPGGFDFDWYNGSVSTGYLDGLMRGTGYTSAAQFLTDKQAEATEGGKPFVVDGNLDWKMLDGSSFEAVRRANSGSKYDDIAADMSLLVGCYRKYGELKMKYQRDHLTALLELELNSGDMAENWTEARNVLVLR